MNKSKDNPTIIEAEENKIAAPSQYVAKSQEQERTFGLKAVDTFIYPVINNAGVFTISVLATFLTSHGDKVADSIMQSHADNPVAAGTAWFCAGMKQRGDMLIEQFGKVGIKGEAADMAKMVTFSFVDGCLMAPFVKMLEDNRENMARKIDEIAGTKPEDESVYAAEPKQGWGSLIGGRALTAAIVVPTAVLLEKTGLNNKLFGKPSEWITQGVQHFSPDLITKFGREPIKDFAKILAFEAFYTAICTEGLKHSSRFLANHFDDKGEGKQYPQEKITRNEADFLPITELYGNAKTNNELKLDFTSPETLIRSNQTMEAHFGKLQEPKELAVQV